MTDDIVDLVRGAAEAQDYSGVDNSVGDILDAAADDFADAGTHPTAHDIVMEDYEEACSG